MAERSKIDIQVGSISFSAEGDQEWLSAQLEKVLSVASSAGAVQAVTSKPQATGTADEACVETFTASLASHLKNMKAEKNQVLRFLATADWLRRRSNDELSTSLVSKALSNNHQSRLSNPAECLNQNVGKGFCEKKGKTFFITPEGLKSLGYES